MTLQPTTATNVIVNNAQEVFRIKQDVVNNGDIFRIDQSVRAIAVGPQSDFSEYSIYYLDSPIQAAEELIVNPDQSWVGRLDAKENVTYPNSDVLGSLIAVPKNLYIPDAIPSSFDRTLIYPPRVDLLFYTQGAEQVPDKRPPRTWRTALNIPADPPLSSQETLFPVYGARQWQFRLLQAQAVANDYNVSIFGYKFMFPTGDSPINNALIRDKIGEVTTQTLTGAQSIGMVWNATTGAAIFTSFGTGPAVAAGGYYDYIGVGVSTDNVNGNDPASFQTGGAQLFFEARD